MQRIIDWIYGLYNFIYQNIVFRFCLDNKKLRINKLLKETYRGKRCFILGNGPSLREEDLGLLKDEIVFTVNQVSRNSQFEKITPTCHFWIDKNFFSTNENNDPDEEVLEAMKAIAKKPTTICFYPLNQRSFVEKNGLNNANVRYLAPRLHLLNQGKMKVDISRFAYSVGTVVQQAILTAIYMGFDEIYLLGCDGTSILCTINSALKVENDTYSYDVTENEKSRMEKMVESSRITDYAYSYYMMLKGFSVLSELCENKGIKLINCTKQTVLDMMPKMSMKEIVKDK